MMHPILPRWSGCYRLSAALCLFLLLAACGRDMSDLESYVQEVKARTSSDIEPIPEIHAFTPFLYEPGDRRDPFVPLEFALKGPAMVSSGIRPDTSRNSEPLEAFPLDALSMVGTLQAQGTMFALIRGGDGIVHRVTLGNYMGRNYGKITGISEQEVQLVEIVPDGFGGYMEQPNNLALID